MGSTNTFASHAVEVLRHELAALSCDLHRLLRIRILPAQVERCLSHGDGPVVSIATCFCSHASGLEELRGCESVDVVALPRHLGQHVRKQQEGAHCHLFEFSRVDLQVVQLVGPVELEAEAQ